MLPPLLPPCPPAPEEYQPSQRRMLRQRFLGCGAAFLVASPFFYIAFSTFGTFWLVRSFTFSLVLAHAVVVGLPIFLILWWRRWVNPGTCIGAGAVVATVSGLNFGLSEWGAFALLYSAFFGALTGAVFLGILLASGVLPPSGDQKDAFGVPPRQ